MMRALTILTAVVAVFLLVVVATPQQTFACDSCKMEKNADSGEHPQCPQKGMEKGEMMKGGMMGMMKGMSAEQLYSADKLYTCPMHSEFVTADSDATCPICNMQVKEMSPEQIQELRDSNPKGCPMCSMVVPGDDEMMRCPTCRMEMHEFDKSDKDGMKTDGKMGGMGGMSGMMHGKDAGKADTKAESNKSDK